MTEIYDSFLSTKIREHLQSEERDHTKRSFWATDTEKPLFELYHSWIGTPVTNPIEPEKLVMFIAAKMCEMALIEMLQKIGIVKVQEQERIEMTRRGVPVSGYMDGVFTDGSPIEAKTFYGSYQLKDLKAGLPKLSYLKQLAVYMDAKDVSLGKLVLMERGTGEMFEFTLVRTSDLKFKCMAQEFDLDDTYKRWSKLYQENILPKIEPDIAEYRYKYDIKTVDWSKVSSGDISRARTGAAVYGDWQLKYSPYKNLWLQKQGSTLGYSDEELAFIRDKTKGYTSKYKK